MKRNLTNEIMFNVELRFFLEGKLRVVSVPKDELLSAKSINHILDMIFKYGQNDFQPQRMPSVSMGDVIRYNGDRYLIMSVGFRKLKPGQFTKRRPGLRNVLFNSKQKKQLMMAITRKDDGR